MEKIFLRKIKNIGNMRKNMGKYRESLFFCIAALAAAIVLMQGCTKMSDERISGIASADGTADEAAGKRKISLKIDFRLSGIEEKEFSAPLCKGGVVVDESLLEDINLYVTDELGDLVYHKFSKGRMDFEVEAVDKKHYSIYAIANAGEKIAAANAEEIEWLSLSIPDISCIKSYGGAVLMSGKTTPQLLDSAAAITVNLTRCVAKINLMADYSQLNKDVDLKVTCVELKNVPSTVALFRENKIISPSASITGETIYNPGSDDLAKGLEFYQLENMQGTLQPENVSQKEKTWPQGSLQSQICSYMELQATYSSPRKTGNILYRFYLGNDMFRNFDVKRNTQLNVTVSFKGDGAVEENTWRVDNSGILDLVTGVTLNPTNYTFTELGASMQLSAAVTPVTAHNSTLKWSSTNGAVAQVDESGRVTSISEGECTIYATSTDGTNISASCNITVDEPEFLELTFASGANNMYDGQKMTLPFSAVATAGRTITAQSSNVNIAKVISASEKGVQIEALAPGETTITAQVGDKSTSCEINAEKLRIVAAETALTTHNHFYTDLEYTIYPAFADKDFTVKITPSVSSIATGFEGIGNRIIPQYPSSATLPANAEIILSLNGRPDINAKVSLTVKPMLEMVSSMKVNANLGNKDAVKELGLAHHTRGNVKFRWPPADGKKYYGEPGVGNVEIYGSENKIVFPIPNSANGLYRLEASVIGDDGYGSSWESDATKFCEIVIYETVYLVGVSKTIDRNKVAGTKDTWEYENEIVAKWLSHPNSLIYPQGELFMELGFKYKGKAYTSNETGETETFTFAFEKGETIPIMLQSEGMTYNGTPPQYYMEFFGLEPDGSAYHQGNPTTGEPYLYIFSRSFASGFTKNASPDWKKIFELIYP